MTSEPNPGYQSFRSLCRLLGGQGVADRGAWAATPTWPHLVTMAEQLDLLPALAVRLEQLGAASPDLGAPAQQRLQQALLDNTRRNMQITAQAVKLARCLNRADIKPLFLKGAAWLLTEGSDTVGFRQQVDIDLLVAPGEVEPAGDALLAEGYRFCLFPDNDTAAPLEPGDTASAIRAGMAHHHLPPLVKEGYGVTVELHTHFLPARFQRNNSLAPLLAQARPVERHGARFMVASVEYQLIHLVLGKFVHDGYQSRRSFPIREGCDLIRLLDAEEAGIDHTFVLRRCGHSYPLFLGLVCELMGYRPQGGVPDRVEMGSYLHLLQKRFSSVALRGLLDRWARTHHLAHQMVFSPLKLPGYLRRRLPLRGGPARQTV